MSLVISLSLASGRDERFLDFDQSLFCFYCLSCMFIIRPQSSVSIENAVSALFSKVKWKKIVKFAEFAVGTMGAVLFQNFFWFTSFSEVLAFLCLAVAWLAKLALLRFWCFEFLTGEYGVFAWWISSAYGVWHGLCMVLLFFCMVCVSRLSTSSLSLSFIVQTGYWKLCYGN